jgi:isopentenyl-diphosphate delta-isomerase
MGFVCPLKEIFTFVYKAKLGELTEYEFDHVFSGIFSGQPRLNKEEAEDYQWIETQDLKKDIKKNPDRYTFWFKIIFKEYCQRYH